MKDCSGLDPGWMVVPLTEEDCGARSRFRGVCGTFQDNCAVAERTEEAAISAHFISICRRFTKEDPLK